MAVTEFQRRVCRLLAATRITSGERYIAGGVALNELLEAPRVSRDIDLFHDTAEAVQASWEADRGALLAQAFDVRILRERPSYVEARVSRGAEAVRVEWARDRAFRFFPLVEHPEFGLVLHPFDLGTNKVPALVGRLEPRDWVDVIECDRRLQPLGYLAWAAAGKDPGFTPTGILAEAARTSRYTQPEVEALDFGGAPPDAAELSRCWHEALAAANEVVEVLPAERAGECVLDSGGDLLRAAPGELRSALRAGAVRFHAGRIGGALPRVSAED